MERARIVATAFYLFILGCAGAGAATGMDICGHREAAWVQVIREDRVIGQFSVAVADAPQSRRQGLMHCPSLDPGTGMLFVYPRAGKRAFWMKDTPIELAIIFISADGRIAAIERGEPRSREHIRSPGDVQSVLEIDYRESRSLAVGDRVRVRMIADGKGTIAAPYP